MFPLSFSTHFPSTLLLCWLASIICKDFVNCKSEITGDSFLLFENQTCLIIFQVCRNYLNVNIILLKEWGVVVLSKIRCKHGHFPNTPENWPSINTTLQFLFVVKSVYKVLSVCLCICLSVHLSSSIALVRLLNTHFQEIGYN